jgi:hypothetical protein
MPAQSGYFHLCNSILTAFVHSHATKGFKSFQKRGYSTSLIKWFLAPSITTAWTSCQQCVTLLAIQEAGAVEQLFYLRFKWYFFRVYLLFSLFNGAESTSDNRTLNISNELENTVNPRYWSKYEEFFSYLSTCFKNKDIGARGLSDCVEGRDWNRPRKYARLALAGWRRPWISTSDRVTNGSSDIFFIYFYQHYLYYYIFPFIYFYAFFFVF